MSDSAQERALFQQWITSPSAGYCRRNPDGSRYEWPAERTPEPPSTPNESDSPQPVASEAEIDALEYVVHQGIIGAYDRPILLAWLARLQAERTPEPPSAPSEGTRQSGCIVTRLRQTRADMIGTDDEQHYFVCHDAAAEIERLRSQPCPYVAGTVTRYCTLTPLTLTDAEREAIEEAAHACGNCNGFGGDPTRPAVYNGHKIAATLRGLLERLGLNPASAGG